MGITRFAQENGIPDGEVPAITASLLKIVNDADPPPGRSASAHNFVRRSAAGALAAMGNLGPDDAVLKAFEAVLLDPNTRPTMRCDMMQFLGELRYPPGTKVDVQRLANLIGHQMVDVCRQEIDRAAAESRDPSRRVLMYAVYSSGVGVRACRTAANDRGGEAYKFVSGLQSKISSLYRLLEDAQKAPDDQLAEIVSTEITDIHDKLQAAPVAAGPLAAAGAPQE